MIELRQKEAEVRAAQIELRNATSATQIEMARQRLGIAQGSYELAKSRYEATQSKKKDKKEEKDGTIPPNVTTQINSLYGVLGELAKDGVMPSNPAAAQRVQSTLTQLNSIERKYKLQLTSMPPAQPPEQPSWYSWMFGSGHPAPRPAPRPTPTTNAPVARTGETMVKDQTGGMEFRNPSANPAPLKTPKTNAPNIGKTKTGQAFTFKRIP